MGNKIHGILLAVVFMLCMISEASAGSYGDVRVSVTRNKANYSQEEVACLTVLVENMMDKPIYHVRIEEHLPNRLQLADESGIFAIDEIPANASASRSFYVMKQDGLSIVAKADKAHYNKGETAELKVVVTNYSGRPVRNVKIEHLLPGGLQYVDHSGGHASEHSALEPGESVEYVVRVRVMDPLPETGDQSDVQILVCIGVMLTAALLTVKIRKWREAK